jgi:hypothetical protein
MCNNIKFVTNFNTQLMCNNIKCVYKFIKQHIHELKEAILKEAFNKTIKQRKPLLMYNDNKHVVNDQKSSQLHDTLSSTCEHRVQTFIYTHVREAVTSRNSLISTHHNLLATLHSQRYRPSHWVLCRYEFLEAEEANQHMCCNRTDP